MEVKMTGENKETYYSTENYPQKEFYLTIEGESFAFYGNLEPITHTDPSSYKISGRVETDSAEKSKIALIPKKTEYSKMKVHKDNLHDFIPDNDLAITPSTPYERLWVTQSEGEIQLLGTKKALHSDFCNSQADRFLFKKISQKGD